MWVKGSANFSSNFSSLILLNTSSLVSAFAWPLTRLSCLYAGCLLSAPAIVARPGLLLTAR